MAYTGGCQCGKTRYRAEAPRDRTSICFCRMCQKASGGPFMTFVRFPVARVAWSTPPSVFASSNLVERGFCGGCGTPLTYRRLGSAWISLTLHSLDDPPPPPELSFATEQQPGWLATIDRLPRDAMNLAAEPGFVNHQKG